MRFQFARRSGAGDSGLRSLRFGIRRIRHLACDSSRKSFSIGARPADCRKYAAQLALASVMLDVLRGCGASRSRRALVTYKPPGRRPEGSENAGDDSYANGPVPEAMCAAPCPLSSSCFPGTVSWVKPMFRSGCGLGADRGHADISHGPEAQAEACRVPEI